MPPTEVDILHLRREVELSKKLLQLRKDNALAYFEPHEKQYLFYQNSSYHSRYARTGNRFGKSELGAAEDVAWALGYRPWMEREFDIINGEGKKVGRHLGYKGHPLATLGIPTHPTKGLIVTTNWDKSEEIFTATNKEESEGHTLNVVQGKLFRYIPKDKLGKCTRNHAGKIDNIYVRHISGGWSLICLDTVASFKQDSLGQESSAWDWCHYDEPIPEAMWKAISRGFVDRDGSEWFTCTPLTEPWIDSKFSPSLEDQSKENAPTFGKGDYWMMTGSIDDNPYNTQGAKDRFMAKLTEEEKECRRTGIPAAYAGIVYKEFSWSDHVYYTTPAGWKDKFTPPSDFTLRFAIDYHPRKPHHVLFLATSPNDVTYAYAEIWLSCLMSELVTEIKNIFGKREATVPGLIDPLASTPNRVTDITPLEEVVQLGLPVFPATKDPHNGILAVKAQLKQRDRAGFPTFFVNSDLRRFLSEISRGYIWDGETNKPLKVNDDAMENLYRLCLQGLDYIEPVTDEDYSIHLPKDLSNSTLDVREFDGKPESKKTKFNLALRHRQRG